MINLVALSLVVASLAAAGGLSPTPETQQKHAERTIIKDGHRGVVVEYDQDGPHSTKISITPEQQLHDEKFMDADYSGVLGNAKQKIKETASVLPNVGKGLSQGSQDYGAFLHAPRELICDGYGKCKHKIAGAMGKAKETAQEAIDKKKDIANEFIAEKEAAREVGETVADAVGKAKNTVSHKGHDVQEHTKKAIEKAKGTLKEAMETGKTIRNDLAGNVSEEAIAVKEAVKHIASYLGSMETLDNLMGVGNLLGFATAYGLCVWVTFVLTYVLSRAMPRQQFGVVQSKIYPVYFKAMVYSVGMALLGHVLRHRKIMFFSKAEVLQAYNLLAALLTVFVNSIYLEPRASKVLFERMKIEKEEGRGRGDVTTEPGRPRGHQHAAGTTEHATTTGTATAATPSPASMGEAEDDAVRSQIIRLNDKLKRLNSYSSLLNILNLMSLTWHLVYLAQRLHHSS